MNVARADGSLLGIAIFIGAIVLQMISALRKGTPARPPVPGVPRSPGPVVRRPAPAPRPSAPWKPEPVIVPAPMREESSSAPLPPKLREIFDELAGTAPGPSVPVPSPATPFSPSAVEVAARPSSTSAAWARLGVGDRAAWQRAFILSEVIQPPVALRPDALARGAHS